MHVFGLFFGCTDFDEFVRMALFLVDSGTLLSQPHYTSTPGGAGFQKTGCLGVWDLVLNCFMVHLWESPYMKPYQEME